MGAASSKFRPTDLIGLTRVGTHPANSDVRAAMFRAALVVLHADSQKSGLDLVLRDHAHGHFCVGTSLAERPSLLDMVAEVAPVLSLVTVRHPLESFLALQTNGWIHFGPPSAEEYVLRYHYSLDSYKGVAVMRYEDFASAPEPWLSAASELLELAFSPMCLLLFPAIRLSGDSGRSGDTISPRPPRVVPPSLRDQVDKLASYSELLDRLGYKPDEALLGK